MPPGGDSVPRRRDGRDAGAGGPRGPRPRARAPGPRRPGRPHRGARRGAASRGASAVGLRAFAGGVVAVARPDGAVRGGAGAFRGAGARDGGGAAAGDGVHRAPRAPGAGADGGGERVRAGLSGARRGAGGRRERERGCAGGAGRDRGGVRSARVAGAAPGEPLSGGGAQRGGGGGAGGVAAVPGRRRRVVPRCGVAAGEGCALLRGGLRAGGERALLRPRRPADRLRFSWPPDPIPRSRAYLQLRLQRDRRRLCAGAPRRLRRGGGVLGRLRPGA